MKYLKYRHCWSSGRDEYEFYEIDLEDYSQDYIDDIIDYLEWKDHYAYSDSYRGIDYEVVDIDDLTVEDLNVIIENNSKEIEDLKNTLSDYQKMRQMLEKEKLRRKIK